MTEANNTPIKKEEVLKDLNPNKVIIPILIGFAAVLWLIISNDDINLDNVLDNLQHANLFWLFMSILVLAIRDGGYMYRIRHLTDRALNWKSSFYIILLWEFSSAITPSVVGGTTVAMFFMNKEGIPFGKAMAYVLLTAILDNLFFVIASLLVVFFVPFEIFPQNSNELIVWGYKLPVEQIFMISVSLIAIYTFFMSFGIFFKPKGFKWLLIKITEIPFLKRWREAAIRNGDEMIAASDELKHYNYTYWLKAIFSTIFVWSARYMMLNCLIAAFSPIGLMDHLLIFSRQIVMWIVMLISPTPGSAGTAEWFFELFFKQFFTGGFVLIVAVMWRLLTYYAYLIIGLFIIPRWVKRFIQ